LRGKGLLTTSSVCGITNKEDIELFTEKVNAHHPTIKFTAEVLQIETTFLDTKVCKRKRFEKERILDVCTHFKPTVKPFSTLTSNVVTQQALKKV